MTELQEIVARAQRVLDGNQTGRYSKRMLARDVLTLAGRIHPALIPQEPEAATRNAPGAPGTTGHESPANHGSSQ